MPQIWLSHVSPDDENLLECLHERAAILEYDAGLPRHEAEWQALTLYVPEAAPAVERARQARAQPIPYDEPLTGEVTGEVTGEEADWLAAFDEEWVAPTDPPEAIEEMAEAIEETVPAPSALVEETTADPMAVDEPDEEGGLFGGLTTINPLDADPEPAESEPAPAVAASRSDFGFSEPLPVQRKEPWLKTEPSKKLPQTAREHLKSMRDILGSENKRTPQR